MQAPELLLNSTALIFVTDSSHFLQPVLPLQIFMIPLLEQMDAVGYDSMEMWGGATFDVAVRFLKDDPWERVRTFKKYVKKTPLKMVLRGQNLVGYKAYPDDVVEAFCGTGSRSRN